MTFIDLYNQAKAEEMPPTPAAIFIRLVANLTNRSEITVRTWLSGKYRPDVNVRNILGKYFNIDPDELFPPIKDKQ